MADAPTTPKKKKKKPHRFYDYSLLLAVVFLTVFGLIMIYSASSYRAQLVQGDAAYFVKRQGMIAACSAVGMLLISKIDYHWFAKFAYPAYFVSLICMVATMLFGVESHGKKRWLQVGPIQFQPTEMVKISLILFLAVVISRLGLKINEFKKVRAIIIWCGIPALLITENNLSSGIITCGIVFVVLFVACKIKWPFFACAGAGVGLIAISPYIGNALVALRLLKPYQLDRITAWVDPTATDTGYQTLQGLYAIGSQIGIYRQEFCIKGRAHAVSNLYLAQVSCCIGCRGRTDIASLCITDNKKSLILAIANGFLIYLQSFNTELLIHGNLRLYRRNQIKSVIHNLLIEIPDRICRSLQSLTEVSERLFQNMLRNII